MTITNGYATLKLYKLRFFGGNTDDNKDDEVLEDVIEAVSRLIDNITHRRFYVASETRYYTANHSHYLPVDDLIAISAIATDGDGDRTYETTWDTGDYDLMPFNAAADTYNVEPYTWLETSPLGSYAFPTIARGVEITASFGYRSSAPYEIQEACLLGAHRMMKRLQTPLGVSAGAALGQLTVTVQELRADPDFMALVQPYIRII